MDFDRLARQLLALGAVAFLATASPAGAAWAQGMLNPLTEQRTQGAPGAQSGFSPEFSNDRSSDSSERTSSVSTQIFQPADVADRPAPVIFTRQDLASAQGLLDLNGRVLKSSVVGEFEDYVASVTGRRIPRYGQDLILPSERDFATPSTATVPPDYRINVGDTVEVSFVGSVTGTLEREVDTNGRIFLPEIGPVQLAGVRHADLRTRINETVGEQYRDFAVTVSVKKLRGIRVYVTGFANNPGAFTVNSLSTLVNAVFQAGGPSAGGSFRSVKLYRDGRLVSDFDLYQLLRDGDRLGDAVLQNEDVLFIPPAGEQVAVIGSVQREAIYEILPGETLEALLRAAGGANVLADPDRLVVYSMKKPGQAGPQIVARSDAARTIASGGDIVQLLSKGSLRMPVAQQSVIVRLEGEVARPGNYYLPPNTPIASLIEEAGGLTNRAYPFGAKLERQSVRDQQKEGYQDAIRQLEFMLASAPLNDSGGANAAQRASQAAGARELLAQLKKTEPDGRVVMLIPPTATSLPAEVLLENNDRVVIPARSTVVGVFGAVYRQGSFLLEGTPMKVRDYIEVAGGTQRAADKQYIFVVRANGEVLTAKKGALSATVLPGDVVFVPVKASSTSIWNQLRVGTETLFQFAVIAAAIGSL